MPHLRATLTVLVCFCLLGCLGKGDEDGTYIEELGKLSARYQVVDLASGRVTAAGSLADLLTNPDYRRSKMVFRLVDLDTTIGTATGDAGDSEDPTRSNGHVGPVYVGVFEVTQEQWQRIAGTSPWSALQPVDAADVQLGADRPAVGATHSQVRTSLQSYSASRDFSLRLPKDVEWEAACLAGSRARFAWGDALDSTTAGTYAHTWETRSQRGALAVGSLRGNSLNFYDAHGNVAELTADGNLRGGSWNTPVMMARAAHIARIGGDVAHATVGMRLVYMP